MDCSLPGSFVHGILQERTLQWVAMFSSRGSCQLRDQTQISLIAGGFFTIPSLGEFLTQELYQGLLPCRQILLPAELSGKPFMDGMEAYSWFSHYGI